MLPYNSESTLYFLFLYTGLYVREWLHGFCPSSADLQEISGVPQALRKAVIAPQSRCLLHYRSDKLMPGQCLAVFFADVTLACPCPINGCVEKIPLEHNVVAFQHRDNDALVFTALAFVDRY